MPALMLVGNRYIGGKQGRGMCNIDGSFKYSLKCSDYQVREGGPYPEPTPRSRKIQGEGGPYPVLTLFTICSPPVPHLSTSVHVKPNYIPMFPICSMSTPIIFHFVPPLFPICSLYVRVNPVYIPFRSPYVHIHVLSSLFIFPLPMFPICSPFVHHLSYVHCAYHICKHNTPKWPIVIMC